MIKSRTDHLVLPEMLLKLGILRLRRGGNSCLEQADDEAGRVEGEEDQDQRHHGAGQLELLPSPTVGPVESLGFRYLGVNLQNKMTKSSILSL